MIKSPFKFLDSFTLADKDIFFGRDQEVAELYRRVFESKLLLVYGVSGTGKSSLINCGLASRFDDSDWLPLYIRRGNNIVQNLNETINKQALTPLKKSQSITDKLQSIYLDHFKPVYLLFDQFEEIFIFGSQEEKSGFIKLIKDISDSKIQCKIIFILREEFLAWMTDFRAELPDIFSNCYRVEKMKSINAIRAVEGLCRVNNIETEAGFTEELIDKLCPSGIGIELTYMQIYLDRVFHIAKAEKNAEGNLRFPKDLLSKAGNVSDLLGQFLEEQIREFKDPDTGMAILKSFVSVQGTRRQMNGSGINDALKTLGTAIGETDLIKYLTKFVDLRILRERDENGYFELRHDALASKIYEKFTAIEKDIVEVKQFIENEYITYKRRSKLLTVEDLRYLAPYEDKLFLSTPFEEFISKSKNEITRARRTRRTIAAVTAVSLFIVLSGFTLWALTERKKALNEREISNHNYLKAKANNFNYLSQKVAETDPTAGLRLAEYAHCIDTANQTIVQNMTRIYYDNNFYKIIAKINDRIQSIAISPDGNTILTSSDDNRARLWDLDGNELQIFTGHRDKIGAVAFSPDGKNILTGSQDSSAILWDLKGNILKKFIGHDNSVLTVAFSPDGKQIFTGSDDNTGRLWDLKGKVVQVFKGHEGRVWTAAFSPDGKKILTGSWDHTARLWDLQGNVLQIFKGHKDFILSVAFSPGGKSILTGSFDNTARLWDLNGNLLKECIGHKGGVTSVAFSSDGKYILTGSWDKKAILWNLRGELLLVFKGHQEVITSVAFTRDAKRILTGSYDKTIRQWPIHGNQIQAFYGHKADINSVAFSHDGKSILTGSPDKTAILWDLQGIILKVFKGHDDRITSVAFSPDGQNILTGSDDKTARLWDRYGNVLMVLKGSEDAISSVAISPDGQNILTGAFDGSSRLWDTNGNVLKVFKGHGDAVSSVAFSPDGRKVLTGSQDSTAILREIQGNELHVFKGHEGGINCVAFSPDGNSILTGSYDKTARLWGLQGNLIQIFKGQESFIYSVAFSPDGKNILTGSQDNTATIWNIQGDILQVFTEPDGFISSAVFSPDGKYILTGSWDKTARLWEIKMPIKEFQKENDYQELTVEQKHKYGIIDTAYRKSQCP